MAASGVLRRLLVVCNRAILAPGTQAVIKDPRWLVVPERCFGGSSLCSHGRLTTALFASKTASGGKPGSAATAKPGAGADKSGSKAGGNSQSSDSSDSSDSSSDDESADGKKGRRPIVDVETSIAYLDSSAFREAYGDKPVWFYYRRNHKGGIPPSKTRKTCVRAGRLSTGNPCPVCRDEYLVLHHKNVALLKQFVSEDTGEVLSFQKTGVCQKQHKALLVAVEQAQDLGYLRRNVPLRMYNYADYYPWLQSREGAGAAASQSAPGAAVQRPGAAVQTGEQQSSGGEPSAAAPAAVTAATTTA